jgi:hypothetical protein
VLGHQLSTKLGSVERATTAALNASLLAVLQDFVVAVQRAMERRQIDAPLMVVRGDGTLMSDEFAARTPVETIHSGPAASAIGGRFLSRLDDALIVDVGGTTTDIALIEDGQVTVSEEGATVGSTRPRSRPPTCSPSPWAATATSPSAATTSGSRSARSASSPRLSGPRPRRGSGSGCTRWRAAPGSRRRRSGWNTGSSCASRTSLLQSGAPRHPEDRDMGRWFFANSLRPSPPAAGDVHPPAARR